MSIMTQPPYLKRGDKIALLSTARKIGLKELELCIKTLQEWGLEVVLGNSIGAEDNQFAGNDKVRSADFQKMLDDDSIKAILCARGGYGSIRIIDQINWTSFQKKPKWIAGFSDITILHAHLWNNFKIASLHTLMPSVWNDATAESIESLRKGLIGEVLSYDFPTHSLNRNGDISGVLVGGNASILFALKGSVSDLDTSGKILFLEDLDEYLYHMDRMFISLKRAGKFKGLKALLIGGMTEMKDNEIPFGKSIEEIIYECVSEYDYPLYFNFPSGHISNNLAVRLGCEAELKATENRISFKQE